MRIISYITLAGLFFISSCAHLKQAEQYYSAGQYKETINLCQKAIERDSSDVKAYSLLGQSYFAINKLDSSLLAYKMANSMDRGNRFYEQQISVIYNSMGDNLFSEGEYYKAIEKYEQALGNNLAPDFIIEKIGDSYFQAGKHEQALAEFSKLYITTDSSKIADKIAKIKTAEVEAQKLLSAGKVFIDKKQYDKAKVSLGKALEIKPDLIEAQYNLHMATGLRLYRRGAKNSLWDAIEEFGYASAIYPRLSEPHYYMAMAYNKKDKDEYNNAISEFELAIQVEPESKFAKESQKKIKELKSRQKKMREFLSR
ncbi:tetratricopeptide repeat protein [candidate division KSB1 bacterium]|nr:tetratricopeptide repeat protein [candidate division KSB1 bacterium]